MSKNTIRINKITTRINKINKVTARINKTNKITTRINKITAKIKKNTTNLVQY